MKKLQVICEMGKADKRALLIELPQEVIAGLPIADDGSVDTKTFLELLARYYQLGDKSDMNSRQLMEMIFGDQGH